MIPLAMKSETRLPMFLVAHRARLIAALPFLAAVVALQAHAFEPCGELQNAFGPFDYRVANPSNKALVEGAHFTSEVETLTRGNTARTPGGDIDYTLRAFPNHPRALLAMMKLGQRENTEKPTGSRHTVSCWFDRAIRFTPNDGMVRLVYAMHLSRKGQKEDALKQLRTAEELTGEDANLHYNLGLVYLDLKQYDAALKHAHAAYRLGFPLAGLRNRLQQAGVWRDAPATANSQQGARTETKE